MEAISDDATQAFHRLNSALPGKVSRKGQQAYDTSNTAYWSKEAVEITPACIVLPSDANDVAIFIKTINEIKTDYPQVKFAVKGGGRAPGASLANVQDGFTIDMTGLKDIKLSLDKQICHVGAGSLWGDVYKYLNEHSLNVVGGRGASIGVGGLVTGGGISFYSARKGFACDNIVNYEIVIADGSIVQANEKTSPDLFHALKGGSNNFGIVTRFDMATFSATDFLGGTIVWAGGGAVPQPTKAFTGMHTEQGYDENAALLLSFSWVADVGEFPSANIEYTRNAADPPVFKDFVSAPGQMSNSLRISSHTDLATEFVKHQSAGRRQIYVTNTFRNDLQSIQQLYSMTKAAFATLPQQPYVTLNMTIQPISSAMIKQSALRGGNVLGLRSEDGPLVLCLFSLTFDDPTAEEECQRITRKLNEDAVAFTKSRGVWHPWVYLNYAAPWQDPISGYGEDNKKLLQTVSKKYDPEGLFQKQLPGGFKLFE